MEFNNKTIIIVSQQDWGKMFISKHHYAVELAKRGNRVYFMNSPEKTDTLAKGEIVIEETGIKNVSVIKHRFFYPYIIKHKAKRLHAFLLKFHLGKIFDKIAVPVDIVWSFDVSNTIPLASFPGKYFKIFMPVDEPAMPGGAVAAQSARVMFSVTTEILDKYRDYNIPKLFVNHGVQERFLNQQPVLNNTGLVQVGISGNFLRADVDWISLRQMIENNPNVIFNFWGAFDLKSSNLSDKTARNNNPQKDKLLKMGNVKVHGVVGSEELSKGLMEMDCFLICYDIDKDPSGGTNYHKILEYMATGKVIVANNTTTYKTRRNLVEMPVERNNSALPALFDKVINNLGYYNSLEKQALRIAYARQHTYPKNIERIERFINEQVLG